MSKLKKKGARKLNSKFVMPTIFALFSIFMTTVFMNCNFDSPLSDSVPQVSRAAVLEPANYSNIVNELASQYPNDLNETCTSFYFLDKVIKALRAEDVNFGYSCKEGDCESISRDSIAFYKGSQNAQKDLSNVFVIKVIDHICEEDTNPSAAWDIQNENIASKWAFPRLTGKQEIGNINTDLSFYSNCSPEDKQTLLQELANTYFQDFSASCQSNQDTGFLDRVLDHLHSSDSRWGYFCQMGNATIYQ